MINTKFKSVNWKGRGHLRVLVVDGRIILKQILKKGELGSCGLDASGSGGKSVAGYCEHNNASSGSIKGGELFTS
jgi:hypothetical protein